MDKTAKVQLIKFLLTLMYAYLSIFLPFIHQLLIHKITALDRKSVV